MKSRFEKSNLIDTLTKLLFLFAFFSIPVFSFIKFLNIVTWILTVLLFLIIWVPTFFRKAHVISDFLILYVAFAISAFLSAALNLFKSFSFTPFLMVGLSFSLMFYVENSNDKKKTISEYIFIIYIALIGFLAVFTIKYFPDLIKLNFNRLGSLFGDINDICLFLSLGCCLSIYYAFFCRKIWSNIIAALLFVAFAFAAVSCGSKIFILIMIVELLLLPIFRFGKKRWYITLIFYVIFIVFGILIFKLPILGSLKTRINSMINLFFGGNSSSEYDYSTEGRINMFIDGIVMFLRKPFFGWGPFAFFKYSSYGGGWSHNHISDCLSSYGLIGTLLFNAQFVICIIRFFNEKNRENNISLFVVVFFLISMFSVALDGEKIYAFVAPIIFASYSQKAILLQNPLLKPRKAKES